MPDACSWREPDSYCGGQKQVLIIPDPLVANDPRFHDLSIVAQTLEQEGFRVAHMSPDGFLEAEKDSTKDPELWACLEVIT